MNVPSRRPVFFLVDWLPPEFGAVGQYALIFARDMAAAGRSVCLVGLTQHNHQTTVEHFDSGGQLEIRRLRARPANKARNICRVVWALGTNFRLIHQFLGSRKSRKSELIITGSPPFMLPFAVAAKWIRHAALRYRITDFYPEAIIAHHGRASLALAFIRFATWWLRRKVDMFEVLGEDQRAILRAGKIDDAKIELKRDFSPIAITGLEAASDRPPSLSGYVVLLYSGNYGAPHEMNTVLNGYRRHHQNGTGRVALWLNASGTNADKMARALAAEGLIYAHTTPGPLSQLPGIMAAADAHLITLRDGFAGYVLPSKVYACLASRRPIVFVGPAESDVHLLCSQSVNTAYAHVRPTDEVAFAAALDALAVNAYHRGEANQIR